MPKKSLKILRPILEDVAMICMITNSNKGQVVGKKIKLIARSTPTITKEFFLTFSLELVSINNKKELISNAMDKPISRLPG
jgi:hypothetical protein